MLLVQLSQSRYTHSDRQGTHSQHCSYNVTKLIHHYISHTSLQNLYMITGVSPPKKYPQPSYPSCRTKKSPPQPSLPPSLCQSCLLPRRAHRPAPCSQAGRSRGRSRWVQKVHGLPNWHLGPSLVSFVLGGLSSRGGSRGLVDSGGDGSMKV